MIRAYPSTLHRAISATVSVLFLTIPALTLGASFGPQSSTKAQEWGFDFVEEFDGLRDWNMSQIGRVGNQHDDNSTGLERMPKLADGSRSAWGYFSLWESNVSTHAWIGGTAGNRKVWRGTKSASLDLGNTGHGPSRLGLFMGDGYRHWSLFYMVYLPKNTFPTSCIGECSPGAVGVYTEGQPYTYWAAYKFHSFNMGCNSVRCPESNTYGLQDSLTMIKQRNYAPVGVTFIHYNGVDHNIHPAIDGGNSLDSMLGDWFGIEVNLENINSNTQYRVNMWVYDKNGASIQMMRDKVHTIDGDAQQSSWDQFFFGGNNSNSWLWGPTMVSHYYVDDFIVDAGNKGRIGPRYFSRIGTQAEIAPPSPPANAGAVQTTNP